MQTLTSLIKQREAIQSDPERRQLFQQLFKLYANSLPLVTQKENGNILCHYSDEVEQAAEKIRERIVRRDQQIFKSIITSNSASD